MAKIHIQGLSKSFGGDRVLDDIHLHIAEGQFAVLVGPSGCGKSTLLRTLAGLERADAGSIAFDGKPVDHLPPQQREVAMVFQGYALYPHMTVRNNMAFGLREQRQSEAAIAARIAKVAAMLQLGELLDRYPRQLSGGQRQRVAIGRAIVRDPAVFLFDEPMSNLDASLRAQMRVELADLHRQIGATMVYVTHDQVEAMTMADLIVVLNRGRIEQVGTPMDLYRRPATPFVAGFLGAPGMNLLEGELAREMDCEVYGVRPEHLVVSGGQGRWPATVRHIEHLGADCIVYADVRGVGSLTVRTSAEDTLSLGQQVHLSPRAGQVHRFRGGQRLEA